MSMQDSMPAVMEVLKSSDNLDFITQQAEAKETPKLNVKSVSKKTETDPWISVASV